MNHTDEQLHCISSVSSSQENLSVTAYAGCGKTTTLVDMITAAWPIPILALAFNKKIATEMQAKLPSNTTCKTLNALGHNIWSRTIANKITLDTSKTFKLVSEAKDKISSKAEKKFFQDSFGDIMQVVRSAKSQGYCPPGQFGPRSLIAREDFFEGLDDEIDPAFATLIDDILIKSINQAYNGTIDFDDQIFMPTLFGGSFPNFPLICVDEAQDLSALNHAMLRKLARERLIIVGDPNQCQPPGTVISTPTGPVNIENLSIGDTVLSLHRDKIRGRRVLNTASRFYTGDLLKIETANNFTYEATPNHRCMARLNSKKANWGAVYLMRRGNSFRVGKTILMRQPPGEFGLGLRARQEKADAIWLLECFSTKEDTLANEELLAVLYGLPTFCFKNSGTLAISQERLDWMWSVIGDNSANALNLLAAYDRDINYPIWAKDDKEQISTSRQCLVRACNLMANLFEVPVIIGDRVAWEVINITKRHYTGTVHSLEIEAVEQTNYNGLYIANGIVTGNSIYGFRGAINSGMEKLSTEYGMKPLKLSISFRCPEQIVSHSRWHVPDFKSNIAGGTIHEEESWQGRSLAQGEVAIICRNNAPLFRAAMRLLREGRSIQLVGSDIGPALIKILEKLGDPSLSSAQVHQKIDEWKKESKSRNKASLEDRAECLHVFADTASSLSGALAYAKHLFSQEGKVKLMSGHKAKGLEFDTVYHLDAWRIPGKFAETPEELRQENNIKYVIETRAKKELIYIDTEGYST